MSSFVRAFRPLLTAGRVAFTKRAAPSIRTSSVSPLSIAARSFSVSIARQQGRGDVDLSKQLKKELDHEQSYKEDSKFIDKYLAKADWKIDSNAGSSEITMSKTFGNEKIRVIFSISDINNTDTEGLDEMEDAEDQNDQNEQDEDPSFTVHAVISCEKPDKGVLTFETQIEDGSVNIMSVVHYPTATLAHGSDSESDWQRRGLYSGPGFTHLEEDLQSQFTEYLEERGIDTAFAVFVPQLIESREQKEYVNWLGKVREYVDA